MHAAVPEPSSAPGQAAVTQFAHPKVGLLVPLIWPLEYERRYWTSDFFRRAANDLDNLHLFIRLVFESLLLIRLISGLPEDIMSSGLRDLTSKACALVVLHIAFKVVSPGFYAHCRWVCICHFRLFLLLITVGQTMNIRAAVARVGVLDVRYDAVVDAMFFYQSVKGSRTLITARALFMVSFGNLALVHGLMPLVPFLLDIPVNIAYLFAIFRYMSAPMADVFTRPQYAAATQQVCSVLAALPTRQTFYPTPAHSSTPTAGPCGVQHVWLVILFFQLFVGFFLTLYISYTLERRLKLRFLQQYEKEHLAAAATTIATAGTAAATASSRTATTPTTSVPAHPTSVAALLPTLATTFLTNPLVTKARSAQHHAAAFIDRVHFGRDSTAWHNTAAVPAALHWLVSCCFHACVLWLLAALSWQLVADLHVPLARHAKLLSFPGCQYGWYWELVCGGDGPCCPA